MGTLFGNPTKTNHQAPSISAMPLQTSCYGKPLPVGLGRFRAGSNILQAANWNYVIVNSGGGGSGGGKGMGGSGSCIAWDTLIATPEGEKPYRDLRCGDKILSLSPDGTIVHGVLAARISHDMAHHPNEYMLDVYTEGRDKPLRVTSNHYPWIDGIQKREMKDWKVGEELLGINHPHRITRIERGIPQAWTYNCVVEPFHNFFANGVLLHNGGSSGKGKGTQTVNYFMDVDVGICAGPITGVVSVWIDSNSEAPSDTGFSFYDGTYPQSAWSSYPYPGVAHAAQSQYPLGTATNLPTFGWEVEGPLYNTAPGTYAGGGDADPSQAIPYLLSDSHNGLGFPATSIGEITQSSYSGTIPTTPFQITVLPGGMTFLQNLSVTIAGALATCVASSPAAGQYSFNSTTGVYTFNSGDSGKAAVINFAYVTPLTYYQSWCLAAGLWISPYYDSQQAMSAILDDIAKFTYASWRFSCGVLTPVPRGSQSITANGYTYTPPSAAVVSLTDDDFLLNTMATGTSNSGSNDDPLLVTHKDLADRNNIVKLEYLDRAQAYAASVATAINQADVDRTGKRHTNSLTAHLFCDANAANTSASLLLLDETLADTYSFTLDARYAFLDNEDIVIVNDSHQGISGQWVKITALSENEDGTISVTAEEYPQSNSSIATITVNVGSGFVPNSNVTPGSCNTPEVFSPPIELASNQGLEVWVAVDGTNPSLYGGCDVNVATSATGTYKAVGRISGPSRMGTTTSDFPVGSDPDTSNVLNVDMTESNGVLLSGTATDADNATTLCLVRGTNGDEYVSYEVATLTSTSHYALGTYLRRGLYSTPIVDHPTGSRFVRLDKSDPTILAIPYTAADIGKTWYIKCQAFNKFEGGEESLATVTAHAFTLPAPPTPPNVAALGVQQVGSVVAFSWPAVSYPSGALAGYLLAYAPHGTTSWKYITEVTVGTEVNNAAIPPGNWDFAVWAVNVAWQPGSSYGVSATPAVANMAVTNQLETIYDNKEESGTQSADCILPPASGGWGGTLVGLVKHYTGVLYPDGTKTLNNYAPNTGTMSGTVLWTNVFQDPIASWSYTTSAIDTGYSADLRVFANTTTALLPGNTGSLATPSLAIDTWVSGADPNTFVSWSIGYVTLRYLRERISGAPVAGNVQLISDFTPHIDSAPTTTTADSQTISAGGTTVTFPTPFHTIPLVVAGVVSAGTGLYATVESITTTTCKIHIWNSSGVDVGGTANYTATGE